MTERITFHAATDDTRAWALAELLSGASLDDVGALFGVKGVTLASYLPMYWSNVVTRNGKVVLLDPSQERTGHVWTEKDYEILIDWHFGDRMQGRPIDDLAGPLRRSVGAVKDQYYLWFRWLKEAVRRQERGERSIPERMAGRGRARATKRRIVSLTLHRYNAHKIQQVQREMVEAVAPAPKADPVEPAADVLPAEWVYPRPIVPLELQVEQGKCYRMFLIGVYQNRWTATAAVWTYDKEHKSYRWLHYGPMKRTAMNQAIVRLVEEVSIPGSGMSPGLAVLPRPEPL